MRFKSRGALLALMTTLALSAVVVSSAAAALPEFQKEGKPLTEAVKFTSPTAGASFLGYGGGSSCEASMTGETKGATGLANVVIKGECESGYPCIWFEAKELKGTLGVVSDKTEPVAGLLLNSGKVESGKEVFMPCIKGKGGVIYGSVIGYIKPVAKSTNKFRLTFSDPGLTERGGEEFTHFEGETLIHKLEWNSHTLGLGYEATLEMAKAIELKA